VEGLVYLLCAATAVICAVLLLRGYARNRVRLLLWCGLCFAALALENVILFADLVVFPEIDLRPVRDGAALTAVILLVYGLVWEAD